MVYKTNELRECICLENNLFSKKSDAIFYLFTYIVLPVLSVYIGLTAAQDTISRAYWYLTILCNALCCLHDCVNRWDDVITEKNTKVFRIGICITIIIIYTIVEIFFLLNNKQFQFDYILLLYCISIYTAVRDIFAIFASGTKKISKRR